MLADILWFVPSLPFTTFAISAKFFTSYSWFYFLGRPVITVPGPSARCANHFWFISKAKRTGALGQWLFWVSGSMSDRFTIFPSSSMNAIVRASLVFIIQKQWIALSGKTNSIPEFGGIYVRYIKPVWRAAGLSASSASIRYIPAFSSMIGKRLLCAAESLTNAKIRVVSKRVRYLRTMGAGELK